MGLFNSRMTDFLRAALGRKKPIQKPEPRRFRPWLEELEDRRLLTVTFTTVPSTQANFDGAAITSVQVLATGTSPSDSISYSATGLPTGLAINTSTGVISGNIGTSADLGAPYTVQLTATDLADSTSNTASFAWDVNADPILFNNPGTQTNFDGATVNQTVTASDSQNNPLTFAATGLPTGLSMDSTGLVTGTIGNNTDLASPFHVTVTATDSTANASNSETFSWDVNASPVSVTNPGTQTNIDGAIVSLPLSSNDSLGHTIAFTETGLPAGLTINHTTGAITGQIGGTDNIGSPYHVTVTATDATANASDAESFTWLVNASSVTFTQIPTTQTNFDGAAITSVTAAASGLDIGDQITYTATGLPSGLSISSGGVISGLISTTADTGSPYTVVVTATDTTHTGSNIASFQWNVNADPITLPNPGTQTNDDGATISVSVAGTNSQSNSLVYSASGLPTGLTIGSSTGIVTGTIAAGADTTSPYTVIVTATDATANSSNSTTFAWDVNPTPVTVTNPGTQTGDDGASASLQVQATDSIAADMLTYSASNLPSGLTINSSTGKITGQISTSADTGSPYAVKVTATDATANTSASQTFNWDITTGPITLTSPGNQTNSGLDVVKLQVTATDSTVGDTLSYSATGLPTGLSINSTTGLISGTIADSANSGSPYSVTVTATDNTANTATSQSFTWTVRPGPINGVVFFDSNGNGKLDSTDPRLAGVQVVLSGSATNTVTISGVTNTIDPTITTATADNFSVGNSITIAGVGGATGVNGTFVVASILSGTTFTIDTTAAPGPFTSGGTITITSPISVTCTTDAKGNFSFVNPPVGTYTVKVNPVAALSGGKASIANLVSPTGVTVTNDNIAVAGKVTGGLISTAVSITEFLTTTTALNQPFGPVGTGVAIVDHAPTVSKALAAVTLTSTSTTSSVDLAGNFTDADLADSTITMDISSLPTIEIKSVTNTVNPTITTTTATNLAVGDMVTLFGVQGATGVNGTFAVASVKNSTTFTITDATAPGVFIPGGTLTGSLNISGVTNTVNPTITTATANKLTVGESVTIAGVVGATGVNGTFTVASVVSATKFTITTAAPGAYTAGGTVTTPTIDISSVTNTTNPTITTTTANKLVVGEAVTIANVFGATGVNGTFVVASVPTATTFTIKASAPGAFVPSGTLTFNDTITGVTDTVDPTITTADAHHLAVGDTVTIAGVLGATGVNGTFVVASVPSATTFTITTASAPGIYTSGGAVSTLQVEKLDVTLFDASAPQTVANFLDYIKAGEYNNSIFSRLVKGFVLQGGGATFTPATGSTNAAVTSIPIGPTIPNEFKTPNTIDTLAMAQSSGNDASATDQFFINIANNSATSSGTNLDAQNFAVFGKVNSDSTAALNTLITTNTLNATGSTAATANSTVDMSNIPLTGYTAGTSTATSSTFAADAVASNFMTINSVTIDKQADYLTYSVSSSNSSIVTAALNPSHNEQLTLTRGGTVGTATVTVTATDRYGLSVTSTITVTVSS